MAVSKRLRFEILRRDNHTCRYCGASAPEAKLTVDHVLPEALGGTDDASNLVAACASCNNGKTSTNPDSPLVADVAADAIRWSTAIQAAANEMLADLDSRNQIRREFEEAWIRWDTGKGRYRSAVPLPLGWEMSVDRFIAAGLPQPVLLDCIDKAMGVGKVPADNKFRYMCGIAWKKVTELHAGARGDLGGGPAQQVGGDHEVVDLETGRAHLAAEILQDLITDRQAAEARRRYFGEDGEPLDDESSKDAALVSVAYDAVSEAIWAGDHLLDVCELVLELFTPEAVELCDAVSLSEHITFLGDAAAPPNKRDRLSHILHRLVSLTLFQRQSKDVQHSYFDALGADWGSGRDRVWVASHYAQVLRGHAAGPCLVPHDLDGYAPCFASGKHKIWLSDCWLHADGSECTGHLRCWRHTREFAEGLRINPATGERTSVARHELRADPWGDAPF